jgi:hypothetical protein
MIQMIQQWGARSIWLVWSRQWSTNFPLLTHACHEFQQNNPPQSGVILRRCHGSSVWSLYAPPLTNGHSNAGTFDFVPFFWLSWTLTDLLANSHRPHSRLDTTAEQNVRKGDNSRKPCSYQS